jgi:hypothetical protein
MPEGSRWLVIWEHDKKIYEEEIPAPPTVKIESGHTQPDGVLLKWAAHDSGGRELHYLVHWYDNKAAVWRGVAPAQQTTSITLPRSLFVEGPELRVRVLATSGISTGMDEGSAKLDDFKPSALTLTILGLDARAGSLRISGLLSVAAFDSAGRQSRGGRINWYSEGRLLARGSQIDLRQLEIGRHVVRAVLAGRGEGALARSWLIERRNEGFWLHSEIEDPKPIVAKEHHPHPHPPSGARE